MHDCIMQIGMQKIWKTSSLQNQVPSLTRIFLTRKFKWDVTQDSWKLPGNYQNPCHKKSMKLSWKKEIFTQEPLSTCLKITLVPNPRYVKSMWFLETLSKLLKKKYRSLAISGCSSLVLTPAWSNCFCLALITLSLEQPWSLHYTRLKTKTIKQLEKGLEVTITSTVCRLAEVP